MEQVINKKKKKKASEVYRFERKANDNIATEKGLHNTAVTIQREYHPKQMT
jgi:hypothetical protein